MKKIVLSLIILGSSMFFIQCKEKEEKVVSVKKIEFKKEGVLTLKKKSNDSVLAILDIEIAEDEYERQTGLMHRYSMKDERAMLFIFEDESRRSFYMKNTEFSIDIIYIDAKKEVVSIQKSATPLDERSLPSDGPAMYVLEVNAGLSDKWGLERGDRIDFSRE